MKVEYGNGKTEYGPGVEITLSGDDIATAIDAYLVARGVCVRGPRTVHIGRKLLAEGGVYVDPSGFVIFKGEKFSGRGPDQGGGSDGE